MKKLLSFYFLLLMSSQLYAQFIYSDTTWERWYGRQNYQESSATAKHDIEHYDKGYIFHGHNEYPIIPEKPFLKKTDINGYFLWERKLDSTLNKTITAISNYPDGGIIVCGAASYLDVINPMITKLNACMEVEWCKIFRWTEFSYAVDLKVDNEGNIIILTNYYGYSPGERINLIKLNPEGDVLWKKNYATIQDYPYIWNAYASKLLISDDNNYYIAGEAEWPSNNDPAQGTGKRAFFIKVNPDGNEEWVLPFGIYDGLFGMSMELFELDNNQFMSISFNVINNNPLIVSFNNLGENLSYSTKELMPETYVANMFIESQIIEHNKFISIWRYYTNIQNPLNGYMVYDSLLNIIDFKETPDMLMPCSLIKTYNNKIVTVATMREADKTTYYDIYMSKRNLDFTYDTVYSNWSGNYDTLCPGGVVSGYLPYSCGVVVGINEMPTPEQYKLAQERVGIKVQPNPATSQASIILENTAKFKDLSMAIYNNTGAEIFNRKLRMGSQEELLNISNWSRGIYFVVMRSEGRFVGSAKLVVE